MSTRCSCHSQRTALAAQTHQQILHRHSNLQPQGSFVSHDCGLDGMGQYVSAELVDQARMLLVAEALMPSNVPPVDLACLAGGKKSRDQVHVSSLASHQIPTSSWRNRRTILPFLLIVRSTRSQGCPLCILHTLASSGVHAPANSSYSSEPYCKHATDFAPDPDLFPLSSSLPFWRSPEGWRTSMQPMWRFWPIFEEIVGQQRGHRRPSTD